MSENAKEMVSVYIEGEQQELLDAVEKAVISSPLSVEELIRAIPQLSVLASHGVAVGNIGYVLQNYRDEMLKCKGLARSTDWFFDND